MPPPVLDASPAALRRAADALRRGGLVAFPTETVYGLGADATDAGAVAKVFEAKGRPAFDPLIVHVASVEAARGVVDAWPASADRLAAAFWPGPLTLVLPKRARIPDIVTSGMGSVGVRVPRHPVAAALLAEAGRPLAAPSANRFGAISPTRADHVAGEFSGAGGELVDLILDGGPCETGVESTVVSLLGPRPCVLRLGGTPLEALREIVGEVDVATPHAPLASPGMLERHYAPRTPLRLLDAPIAADDSRITGAARRVGLLLFRDPPSPLRCRPSRIEVLSPHGDLREAAANLFAALRRLDAADVDLLLAERAPDEGLGRAINDRLSRAAHG